MKRWTLPRLGVVRINIDAAVSKNMGCGSVAAVNRDEHDRLFRGASARVFLGIGPAQRGRKGQPPRA
jgi:hypothetical protein